VAMRQTRKGSRFLVAALVAAALSGCSTSREQPPAANANANANVATRSEAAQPIAKKAKAKPAATRAAPSPELLSKRTTATILAQIHQANLKEIAISKLAQEKASSIWRAAWSPRIPARRPPCARGWRKLLPRPSTIDSTTSRVSAANRNRRLI
jgi:hypothetical protein